MTTLALARWSLLVLVCASLCLAGDWTVTVQANRPLGRLGDLMLGANMEDLHYQMTGGLSSQLLHGESFFEPSPAEWAQLHGQVAGCANAGGRVSLGADGWLHLEHGTRVTAETPSDAQETTVTLRPTGDGGGLAMAVTPLNAYDRWEWYAGYTAWLVPATHEVVLQRAGRPHLHRDLARAPLPAPARDSYQLALRVDGPQLSVTVDGQRLLSVTDPEPLPLGQLALVAKGDTTFRDLRQGEAIPLVPNPLLRDPGDALSLRWAPVRGGSARGNFARVATGTWHAGCPSQEVTFGGGEGEFGLDNAGLQRWGLNLVAGRPYEGLLRVKSPRAQTLWVSLRSHAGSVLAEQALTLTADATAYQRVPFVLTPSAADAAGRFAVTLRAPGSVTLGYAFLEPGDWGRYQGLPIRRDLAEALLAQGLRVLRFNGGMIERPGYRWASQQGPRDERPPYDGFYDRWCSNGCGPAEIVAFGTAAGLTVIPGLNLDETPAAYADFVHYCNAPTDARRTAAGHPEPYPLRYLQVANESPLDRRYVDKFKQVAPAVWAVDPSLTLVSTRTLVGGLHDTDDLAKIRAKLACQAELAEFCHALGQRLMFDIHTFCTGEDPSANARTIADVLPFARWLKRLAPDPRLVEVGVLELNAGRFDHLRGLAHATELNALHRGCADIDALAIPNVSQPWGVYQTDWKAVLWTQGNLYYTPSRVWYQSAAWVDQLVARHWTPRIVAATTDAPATTLDVCAGLTADAGALVVRLVNYAADPQTITLACDGFTARRGTAVVEELSGGLLDSNTLAQPDKLRPVRSDWSPAGHWRRTLAPHSFTVIRVE